jgi:hypothetical protein
MPTVPRSNAAVTVQEMSAISLSQQYALRSRCRHPGGCASAFDREELEQSIPQRLEKIARQWPERVAVRTPYGRWIHGDLQRAGCDGPSESPERTPAASAET